MCYGDVAEQSSVFLVTPRVARKQHRCAACRLFIQPGVRYDEIESLYDGDWSRYHVHADCHQLTKYIQLTVCSLDVYSPTDLREQVREHIGTKPVKAMYRAVLKARIVEGVWPVAKKEAA